MKDQGYLDTRYFISLITQDNSATWIAIDKDRSINSFSEKPSIKEDQWVGKDKVYITELPESETILCWKDCLFCKKLLT